MYDDLKATQAMNSIKEEIIKELSESVADQNSKNIFKLKTKPLFSSSYY